MADYSGHTDEELAQEMKPPAVDSKTESDRQDLQIEWCKRTGAKFTLPDGTVAYQPPDWPKE